MLEADIKIALKAHLSDRSPTPPLRFIEEFKLERGLGRADVVEIGEFHCYEIKSDADSLGRLIAQGSRYTKTFKKVTLVTAERHLERAMPLLPEWWGVIVIPITADGKFRHLRPARANRGQDAYNLAATLLRDECLSLIRGLGHERGWKTKSLYDMQAFLAGQLHLAELASLVPQHIARRFESPALC